MLAFISMMNISCMNESQMNSKPKRKCRSDRKRKPKYNCRTQTLLISIILFELFCGSLKSVNGLKLSKPSVTSKLNTDELLHGQQAKIKKTRGEIRNAIFTDDQQTNTKATPRTLSVLYATSFLFVFGNTLVAFSPAPALMKELGAATATKVLSILASTSAFLQIVFSPIIGTALDFMGRKPIFVACIFSMIISYASVSLHSSVPLISLAKISSAFFIGIFFLTTQAILSDLTSAQPKQLSAFMGIQLSLTSLGFLCGSIGAGQLVERGLKVPYIVASCIFSVALIIASTMMGETLQMGKQSLEKPTKPVTKFPSPFASLKLLFRHKELRVMVILLLISTMPSSMGEVFQVYAKAEWDLEAGKYAAFIAIFGVIGILGNLVGSLLVRKIGLKTVIVMATSSSMFVPLGAMLFQFRGAVVGSLLGFLSSTQMLTIGAALVAEGSRLGIPQGELAGSRSSIVALLKVIAPVWYSLLYVQGKKLTGLNFLPFIFNVSLALTGSALSMMYLKKQDRTSESER